MKLQNELTITVLFLLMSPDSTNDPQWDFWFTIIVVQMTKEVKYILLRFHLFLSKGDFKCLLLFSLVAHGRVSLRAFKKHDALALSEAN